MIDALLEPFGSGFGVRMLLEVVLLGVVCGPLGVWILLTRNSYAAESLAHAMLPGLVLATLVGVPLLIGGLAGLLIGAILIALTGRDSRVGSDVGVAVTITGMTGAGAILALAPDTPARLQEQLFGNLVGVDGADLWAAGTVAVLGIAALTRLHRSLCVSVFDRTSARSLGASPPTVELCLLAVLAVVIAAAVGGLGSLLVVGFVLAPAAAALRIGRSLPGTLSLAAALAVTAGIGGLYVTYHARLAAGASVAIVAVGIFALALAVGPRTASRERNDMVRVLGEVR